MKQYIEAITDELSGLPIGGAEVFVYDDDNNFATLYASDGSTEIDNPLTTNEDGEFSFYSPTTELTALVYYGKRLRRRLRLLIGGGYSIVAQSAAQAALAASGVGEYPNTTLGLAGTALSETFWVDLGTGIGQVYRHDAGPVATALQSFIIDPASPSSADVFAGGVPTTAALGSSTGGEMVGEQLGLGDTEASTQADWNRDRISLMRWIPKALHAGIRDRSNTTDLSPYIQNALDNTPSGAELYAPDGTYRMASGVSASRSITFVGDPSRENFDNSWDAGQCGTEFDYRGTTGDAFTFAAPDTGNSRINLTLRDFIVRGSRVSASGTAGHCIRINGRAQAGTFVRLIVDNVHVCEAPENGWLLQGDVYGGRMSDIFAHRCGKAGFYAGSASIGEMVFERVRCFQNGVTGTGDDQTCGFYWEAGSVLFNGLSCSENTGPGAYLNGGPITINMLQLESNTGTSQILLGRASTGIQSVVINGIQTAPGTGYTGSHIYLTQYCLRASITGGFLGDTLGAGGEHIYRQNANTDLSYEHLGSTATFTVTDLSAAGFGTHQMVRVFARNAATFDNCTGDGTNVDWIPGTEIFDNLGAYNAATGVFTAPVTGFYDVEVAIPLADLSASFDNASIFFTASSYSRTYRMGNVGAMRSNVNQYTMQARARIPMAQGETLKVVFNVGGGTKTVDIIADALFGFLSITTAH